MAPIAHTPYYLVTFAPELGLSFSMDGRAYEMRMARKRGASHFQVRHATRMPRGELLSALDYAHGALGAMQQGLESGRTGEVEALSLMMRLLADYRQGVVERADPAESPVKS